MRKVIILLLLLVTISFFGQEPYQSTNNMLSTYRKESNDGYSWRNRENKYDKKVLTCTKEKLLSTIWVTDPFDKIQHILVFYTDDAFKVGTRQSGVLISGKYTINKDSIILSDYDSELQYFSRTGLVINKTNCTFNINSNHLIYRDYIVIGEIKYYAVGSEQSNGTELFFNSISVIVDSDRKVMNENMKFRDYPSINGKLIRVYQYGEFSSKETTSLKKGTVVTLLAKTKKTETIEGVTASWYFVKVFDGFESFQYGWVFGGYFTTYDQNKNDEYWKIVLEELEK